MACPLLKLKCYVLLVMYNWLNGFYPLMISLPCSSLAVLRISKSLSKKRGPLRHLPPFHVPRVASDVEDHVFRFALYGVAKIWKSSVTHDTLQPRPSIVSIVSAIQRN